MGKKITISYSELVLFVFFLLYFQPVIIERISGQLDFVSRMLNVVMFVSIAFVRTIRNKRLVIGSRFNSMFIVFNIWNIICILFMAPGIIFDYFKELIYIVEFWTILNLYSDEIDCVWNSLSIVSATYIIINSLSLLMWPNGLFYSHMGSSIERAQWILGSKNNIALYTIIFLMFIHIKEYKTHKSTIMLIDIIAFMTVACSGSNGFQIVGGSSTGIAACAICIMLLSLNVKNRLGNFRMTSSLTNCLVLLSVFNAVFLFGSMTFGNYISGLFNKKLIYGGRIPIWQTSLKYISKSPLFGYGYNRFGYRFFNGSRTLLTTYTYNTVLGILIRYGLISAILLALVIISVKKSNTYITRIVICIFFSLGIWGIMNELDFRYIFIPLICIESSKEEYNDNTSDNELKQHLFLGA
ncbi:O-antigen ligase family protein [Butyrivibrio sp. DSM 10294]|uniref:O-antigen ligase family protein n=1 Tax=Butyrivibrio sp. DSM 10294 TaxID=2972457 RepID=UPI00234F2021|nr:O-antigen ligase family protein [Butyrivibrio sp. DSM 10294]MDC7292850.1 O-antigen ligase family protein [Butyrivibrio sp. DSM 10294]